MRNAILIVAMLSMLAVGGDAFAKKKKKKIGVPTTQDAVQNPDAVPAQPSPQTPDQKLNATPPSLKAATAADQQQAAAAGEDEETKNNRQRTAEGSKSPISGQANLTWSGSSLDHPFSKYAPNSGHESVPPLVSTSGTVSARYRFTKKTTAGVGTGLTYQGYKKLSVADPYVDLAHSFKWGPIQNRADGVITMWTSDQQRNGYGNVVGFSAVDEAFYEFDFGLTAGLALEIDFNIYKAGDYDPSGQTTWDIYPEPYFEFQLSKRVNLRSVVGVGWDHNRDLSGDFVVRGPRVYQTLGVGISAAEWLFLYPYIKAYPYSGNLAINTTRAGMNVILNLF